MGNITKAYEQLQEGTITKSNFVRQARTQFPQYISPVTGYNDIVRILKSKRLISESHKFTIDQILDRLSPYAIKKGIECELAKEKVIDDQALERVKIRVAKKLQKNPKAYDDIEKSTEKNEERLKMKDFSQSNKVDTANKMKIVKPLDKANTKASKKENKKGKPTGVKVFPDKGVEGSEKVLSEAIKFLLENSYHDFNENMQVETPEGTGIVREILGGTLKVELKGGNIKDFQMNSCKKATEGTPMSPYEPGEDKKEIEESDDVKLKSMVEKVIKALKKKKMKEAGEEVSAQTTGGEKTTLGVFKDKSSAQKAILKAKQQGITSAQSTTLK